ncbi:indole-3-glycerol phosphate synthase TrpC [Blattabacterium cuenoti]|uniref:indole-3-glycerol phosphate synthase TrpC n=1 Tax=Blattabacterium cuenoti TaxID=1653831 RepID=UPI00163B8D08|nr:indole-3-glycerol phosphate synthase TrpC [Blattabacterium cuenoti]
MNLLDRIISFKKKEVQNKKILFPIKTLEKSSFFERKIFSLKENLKNSENGVIAEFKLKSPSRGIINHKASLNDIIKNYEKAGVSGISVLTDYYFFLGKDENMKRSRSLVSIPLLRKDFIIDEYQILESKSIGSDVILLIAKILEKKKIEHLSYFAKRIGLEVILEIHEEHEIEKITNHIDMIGINNRNLNNFEVDKNGSFKLCSKIPKHYIKIAESGIDSIYDIITLEKNGFQGFLIGEFFMKKKDPGVFCQNFITFLMQKKNEIKNTKNKSLRSKI